jgi:hypothetical protein
LRADGFFLACCASAAMDDSARTTAQPTAINRLILESPPFLFTARGIAASRHAIIPASIKPRHGSATDPSPDRETGDART